ncbi:transcriptional regulator, GntR family [Kribbella flavida DSM 17836]|uniref:Transcriptional regulator, GntR family n=1 Tax=Kribbella flavida (strain DSM 17836 / JCM 10339 / NBRC 14399) TaxID=479435 RepID=D2PPX5_KRIFD|nr:GntR family transcriptional regulator [Kribbella flavida]ADB32899.1 transcriptional regulator, GntR family [Kribbella flavida DSM 17836]
MQSLDQLVTIDRSSPVPLYFQVAQRLQNLIESGQIPPGARLDNELVVAEQLGLSRPTVRQALQYLVEKGMLSRKRGVGTSVVNNRLRRKVEMTSLYEDLERAGRRPRTEVLSCELVPAPEKVAAALLLEPGTEVLALERLRFADDEPLAILRNHVRADLGVTAEGLASRGLYQLLRAAGTEVKAAEQTVGARQATATEATLLQESRGATLLKLHRVAFDADGRPVEFGRDLYRASLYSIDISVGFD